MSSTATPPTDTADRRRWAASIWPQLKDGVGLACRLVLGAVLIAAGYLKVTDPVGATQSVVAYHLFPYSVAEFIGVTLPVIEISVGALLVLGLFTRVGGVIGAGLMLAFIAGIASAWARGLAIDCGCFGTGGPVDPSDTAYAQEILRDTALAAAGLWLVLRPRTLFSLDGLWSKSVPDERNI